MLRSVSRKVGQAVPYANPQKMIDSAGAFERVVRLSPDSIGKMYFVNYDPKWKEKLPYYDTFPLIFPIEFYPDGMLSINLHYLPPFARAQLMDRLYTTLNNTKYDSTTKFKIIYGILKGASQFSYFRPCIKKHLFSHVRSPYIYIKPEYWDMTLFLPTARWQKANQDYVWTESMKMVGSTYNPPRKKRK